MAYAAPPTFADNSAPTAAEFNVLSDDIAYLDIARNPINAPTVLAHQNAKDWAYWRFEIVHQFDTLAIEYTVVGGDLKSSPVIRYDGDSLADLIVGGGSFSKVEGTRTYTVDLSSLELTVGNLYMITISIVKDDASMTGWNLNYLYETPGADSALPRQWAHGDVPTAAYLNVYSTNIVTLYDQWENAQDKNLPVPFEGDWHVFAGSATSIQIGGAEGTNVDYRLTRRYRWLHYYGEGTIKDPGANNDDVTLDDQNDEDGAVYDLESAGWIAIGTAYTLTGLDCCIESELANA